MNTLNNIFNTDEIEINSVNKKYSKILLIIIILVSSLLLIKKDYYYENILLIDDNNIFLLVDKDVINSVKDKKTILVNKISNNYSINRIIDKGDICYMDIKLNTNISNISNTKYKTLLGKESVFEYIIRTIKKVSWRK